MTFDSMIEKGLNAITEIAKLVLEHEHAVGIVLILAMTFLVWKWLDRGSA